MDFNENERSDRRCQDEIGDDGTCTCLGLITGDAAALVRLDVVESLRHKGGAILNQSIFAVTE